jgi:hypothetical protein
MSSLATALDTLRNVMAASPAWQLWTVSANATAALERVHLLTAPIGAAEPFAIIDWNPGYEQTRVSVSPAAPWNEQGTLLLYIRAAATESASAHLTNLDALLDDLRSAVAAGLKLASVRLEDGPQRTPAEDRERYGDAWESVWQLEWRMR